MKRYSIFIAIVGALTAATLNTACQKSEATVAKAPESAAANGAQFKKGEGLSLTDEMRKAIGLTVEDVTEEKIASSTTIAVSVSASRTLTGWVTPAQAATIRPGMEVECQGDSSFKGTVEKIEANPLGAMADSEITIRTGEPLTAGSTFTAVIRHPAGETVPVVPKSAVLKTAEGEFVYTVNGKFYVRTPVKTGAADDKWVEITDGLYPGDQIVTTAIMSLWMAELQVLRGGKACTCGH